MNETRYKIPPFYSLPLVKGGLGRDFIIFVLLVVILSPLVTFAAPIVPCGIDDAVLQSHNLPTTYQFGGVTHSYSEECTFTHFIIGINNIINFLIEIGGSIAALVFAYAGFLVLTAGGNEAQVKTAKGMFWTVLKGFGLMLAAWLLVKMVLVGLGVTDGFSFLG